MNNKFASTNYADYLRVHDLIQLQERKSEKIGNPAHEEMLFIITHQVYELWFKQILFEVDSILEIFAQDSIEEGLMLKMIGRLERVIGIQKLLIQQVDVLETMTPLDFLDFRELLVPASGFQSQQFRLIENKMGLNRRLRFNNQDYKELLKPEERPEASASEKETTLFNSLEAWLERTPFIATKNFDFWQTYKGTVEKMFNESEVAVKAAGLDPSSQEQHLASIKSNRESFEAIFNPDDYKKLQDNNHWRLSYKALQAALFIQLYRDEPLLQAPFKLMACLQTLDENFTQWRQRHAQMAHRMLGAKMGTGGSSGHKYLAAAADKHKVFTDLFNLATFLVPRSKLPALPAEIKKKLSFHY